MKKSNEQSLGEVIKQFIKAFQMEDKLTEVQITSSWEKVMGPQISSLTEKITFRDGKLSVQLRSSALREELYMAKTRIIEMINQNVGKTAVKELILK